MVIVEYPCVDVADGLSTWSSKVRPGKARYRSAHAKRTGAIHLAGAKACIKLSHAGRQTREDVIGRQPICPSAVTLKTRQFTTAPRAASETDIARLIKRFARAAAYAIEAGYDAVIFKAHMAACCTSFCRPDQPT